MNMRIGSYAIAALVLVALAGCSSAPRKEAPAGSARSAGGSAKSGTDIGASAAQHALAMRGKPYRYGGYTPQGFDCSGLVHYSYARAGGAVPRNTNGLWSRSRPVPRAEIRRGDLLFFHQDGKRNSHVGLYVGNDRFVHAPSSGKQVATASLKDSYWREHFSVARRPIL